MQEIRSFFSRKNKSTKAPISARVSSPSLYPKESGKKNQLQGIMYKYKDKVICLQGSISSKDKVLSSALRTICKLESDLENTKREKKSILTSTSEKNFPEELNTLLEEKDSEKKALISLQTNLESELGSCKELILSYKNTIEKQSLKISKLKSQLRAKKYEISIYEKKMNFQETTVDLVNADISQSFDSQHLEFSSTLNNQLQEAVHRSSVLALENEQLKIRLEKLIRKNEVLAKQILHKKNKTGNSVLELQHVKAKLQLINSNSNQHLDSLFKVRKELENSYKLFVSEFTQTFDQTRGAYFVHSDLLSTMDKSMNNLLTFIQDRIEKYHKDPPTQQIYRQNTT